MEGAAIFPEWPITSFAPCGAFPVPANADIDAVTAAKTALDTALTAALAAVSDGLPLTVLDFLPAN